MNETTNEHTSLQPISRRRFIKSYGIAVGATMLTGPYLLRGQNLNEKISVACIGVGGKGSSDTDNAAKAGGDIVALCDIDSNTLNSKGEKFPQAKRYRDFRKMLDEMGKSIDAVTVSTPDHCHAVAAVMAMKMGKHIYCQKPLTQTVYEARVMRQLAKEKKLATQMGNQGSANDGLRRAVEVIQAGVIGPVREVHVWSNRPIWPQGLDRPKGEDPVPSNLDWDLWLGPAPFRPFKGSNPEKAPAKGKKGETKGKKADKTERKSNFYHPFAWRGWVDFGTGALGDMACHTVNMPFRAVKMGYPTVVECEETSQLFKETYPKTSRIRFEFPAREDMPPLKFWWYDGNPKDDTVKPLRPNEEITKEIIAQRGELPGSGCLIIGDKGKVFSPDDYAGQFQLVLKGEPELVSSKDHEAIKAVPQTIPRSPGHEEEWFAMMKGGPAAYSNFDIAAYLTEIILLGCIALRVGVGKRMEWDGPNMKSPNCPEAAKFVKRENRKGWTL